MHFLLISCFCLCKGLHIVNAFLVPFLEIRVRFLFGGRHGEFRFLPPPGFAPCSDALLPRVKLKVEPCQIYILDNGEGKQELFGPIIPATPVTFTPTPLDISKVSMSIVKQILFIMILFLQVKILDLEKCIT